MKNHVRKFLWAVLLGMILLVLVFTLAYSTSSFSFKQAARAASSNTNAITPGQFAAIQGAGQLLLMPLENQPLFMPMIRR